MEESSHEFKVSTEELNFLQRVTAGDRTFSRLLSEQALRRGDKISVRMGLAEAEQLRDRLTLWLAQFGFNDDDSPNIAGEMCEGLIDRFYVR